MIEEQRPNAGVSGGLNLPRRREGLRDGLDGRVAIVTGGGKGIGSATAEALARSGVRVLVATRGAEAGEATVARLRAAGGTAELAAVQLGTRAAATEVADRAVTLWGAIDILVHNAAHIPYGLIEETADEDWLQAMDVGPSTGFWLLKEVLPWLRRSNGGRAIFVSSLAAGRQVSSRLVAYAAAKGAIEAFVRGAALELASEGITVNAVAPGGTMTENLRASMSAAGIAALAGSLPSKRLADPHEIAEVIRFLASDSARFVTGQSIAVDGGQSLGLDINLDS